MKAYFFKFCLLILALQLGMNLANAKDIKVLSVTQVGKSTVWDLYISTGEDLIAEGLKMYDNDDKTWKSFDTSNLSKGVVLKKEGNHDVIILKSQDFEHDRGGHFKVDYLSNGIVGSRKDFPIKIDFDGSQWQVFHNGEAINRLDFHLRTLLGETIGIKKVDAK